MSTNDGGSEWKFGIFGCFKDIRLCIVTFIVPCYTVGRNATHFKEDCILWGLLTCVGFSPGPVLRWRLREERKLKGSMMMDVLFHGVLPCCALVQEAQEMGNTIGTVDQELNRQ